MFTEEQNNFIFNMCNFVKDSIDKQEINSMVNKVLEKNHSKKDIENVLMIYDLINLNKYDVLKNKFNIVINHISDIKMPDIDMKNLRKVITQKDKVIIPRKLYISDCHFFHSTMINRFDNRNFEDTNEMNKYMIHQWNSNVNKCDDVYIIGDFSFGNAEQTNTILQQLKGKKHLIIGNHDRYLSSSVFLNSLFKDIKEIKYIKDNNRNIVLSHYPIFCYKGQYKEGTYMLYGHVHNSQDEKLVNEFIKITRATIHETDGKYIPCNMINCFCMFSNYVPLTLNEWIEIDKERRKNM